MPLYKRFKSNNVKVTLLEMSQKNRIIWVQFKGNHGCSMTLHLFSLRAYIGTYFPASKECKADWEEAYEQIIVRYKNQITAVSHILEGTWDLLSQCVLRKL